MVKLLEVLIVTKRIVIFGGTGFMRKHIVRRLAAAEYLIRILTRDQKKPLV